MQSRRILVMERGKRSWDGLTLCAFIAIVSSGDIGRKISVPNIPADGRSTPPSATHADRAWATWWIRWSKVVPCLKTKSPRKQGQVSDRETCSHTQTMRQKNAADGKSSSLVLIDAHRQRCRSHKTPGPSDPALKSGQQRPSPRLGVRRGRQRRGR